VSARAHVRRRPWSKLAAAPEARQRGGVLGRTVTIAVPARRERELRRGGVGVLPATHNVFVNDSSQSHPQPDRDHELGRRDDRVPLDRRAPPEREPALELGLGPGRSAPICAFSRSSRSFVARNCGPPAGAKGVERAALEVVDPVDGGGCARRGRANTAASSRSPVAAALDLGRDRVDPDPRGPPCRDPRGPSSGSRNSSSRAPGSWCRSPRRSPSGSPPCPFTMPTRSRPSRAAGRRSAASPGGLQAHARLPATRRAGWTMANSRVHGRLLDLAPCRGRMSNSPMVVGGGRAGNGVPGQVYAVPCSCASSPPPGARSASRAAGASRTGFPRALPAPAGKMKKRPAARNARAQVLLRDPVHAGGRSCSARLAEARLGRPGDDRRAAVGREPSRFSAEKRLHEEETRRRRPRARRSSSTMKARAVVVVGLRPSRRRRSRNCTM